MRKGACGAFAAYAAAILLLASAPGDAQAQQPNSPDCQRLAAQINAVARSRPPSSARYSAAAQRQQRELARTQAYAASRGCNRRQFLFFGSPPPPQCGPLNARIARMRSNLANLQAHVQNANAGRDAQLRSLNARYDAFCRPRVARHEPNFFERLFGGGRNEPDVRDMPIDPDEDNDTPRGGSKAVCVRTCDGGFFPVSYSARRRNLDDLAEMCTALCPNVETRLYTYAPGREIDNAVSSDGEPYESHPNAGKFKTSFDPQCTCKPPGKNWSQVLAKAEELLDNKSRRDLIVDAKKAEELSKPKVAAAARNAKRKKRDNREEELERRVEKERADLEEFGKREAVEAQKARAGIDPGRATRKRVFSLQDGEKTEIKDANGATRKVRIIAPKL